VEPKYVKKLETLDELLDTDVVFGYHPFFTFPKDTLSYPEFVKFLEHKRLQEDCSDLRKCVERMITKRDIALIIDPFFGTYVVRDLGNVDVGKVTCSLDVTTMSVCIIDLSKKGNVVLERFNILMRRYLEAGLLERLWTELQYRASMRGGGRFTQAAGDIFFAFSVCHKMPAFVVLIVGTVLSSVVFIAELILNCLRKRRKKKDSRITRVRKMYLYHSFITDVD